MKLSIAFYSQMNRQTECINHDLEQYLRFFVDYRQKDQLEWLEIAEFAVNNKTHSVTKILQFVVNNRRELRMKTDIRGKKVEKAAQLVEKIKNVQEKARKH